MSSPQPEPQWTPPSHADEAKSPENPSAPVDRPLLERVLQETLSSGSIRPDEMAALMDVARQHGQQPFELQPVGVELIEAILRFRLAHLAPSNGMLRHMSEQIAASLLENEYSQRRLLGFWNRLVEAVR